MEFDDDTHLCLRCSKTIVGLENYIAHRQHQCINIRALDAANQKSLQSEELACEASPSGTVSTTQNTPCIVHLTADDFFSSLELQSKANAIKSTSVEPANDIQKNSLPQKDCSSNENELLPSAIETAPPAVLLGVTYYQDISNGYDDSDNDLYPPISHTGGKWKPGTRPDLSHRQHWEVVSLPPSPSDETEKNTEEFIENDSINKISGSNEHMHGKMELHECFTCNRKFRDKNIFTRHQMTSYHLKRLQQSCTNEISKNCNLSEIHSIKSIDAFENKILRTKQNRNKRVSSKFSLLSAAHAEEDNNCKLCDITFKSHVDFVFHHLSSEHQQKINNITEWHRSIFKYQKTFLKTSRFQCLICLFYFNDISDFLSHVSDWKHCQRAAQLKRPLMCIPCDFDCRASDEMMNHLTSQHHQNFIPQTINDHPIVITEKVSCILCTFCGGKCHLIYKPSGTKSKFNESVKKKFSSKSLYSSSTLHCLRKKKMLSVSKLSRKEQNLIYSRPSHNRNSTVISTDKLNIKKHSKVDCPYCTQEFENVLSKKQHILLEHKKECKKCTSCNQFFVTYHELKRHITSQDHKNNTSNVAQQVHLDGNLDCSICAYKTNSKNDLLLHKVKHQIPEKVTEEKMEQNGLDVVQKLVEPTKEQQKPKHFIVKKKYKCPYCDKLYPKQHMKFHLYTHTGERPFHCSICEMSFAQRSTLLMHVKRHLGLKHLKCDKCEYKTLRKNDLLRHQRTHFSSRPRPFLCEICGSAQLDQWALNQHMKGHGDCDYKCTFPSCQLAFNTPSKLAYHLRVHNNDRPFLCDVCGYAGRTSHQLKKHQRSHTGERPFKCKYCSYSATLSSHLLRHMRLHTGSKPYRCPYCDYSCNNQENIRKHILKTKKHKGKKMYPCKYCEFACNEFLEYRKHLINVHSEHFPKGEKDIESSVIAGLYVKDCPREIETPIPYSPRQRKTAKKLDHSNKKKRKPKKNTTELTDSSEPVVYLKIPRVNNLDDIDNMQAESATAINHITSNDNCSTACLATFLPDTVESAVPLGDFFTESLPDGTYTATADATGTHFLISSAPDYIGRSPQLENQLPDGQHITHTATVDGSGNTIILYVPVS